MTGIVNREFEVLAPQGQNYLTWKSDCLVVLGSKKLRVAIGIEKGDPTEEQNYQALHFLRHHLSSTLKNEYMAEENPKDLWVALEKRFEKLKYSIKPRAIQDWANLRFADYKTVAEYNSALHKICTILTLCGQKITDEEKIEKTLSTFHPNMAQISRNYRQNDYKEYCVLIDVMTVDESNDDVLRKNFISQPSSSKHVSTEVNANSYKIKKHGKQNKKGRNNKKAARSDQKGEGKPKQKPYGEQNQTCFRCGLRGHWSRICKESREVVNAYQATRKKGKIETHLAELSLNEKNQKNDPYDEDDLLVEELLPPPSGPPPANAIKFEGFNDADIRADVNAMFSTESI